MIETLFSQSNYLAAKKLLDASMVRHEAIASNLANVETPGYKRLDLAPGFAETLREAIVSQDGKRIQAMQPLVVVDKEAVAHGRDGNTVQLETELAELSQNSVEHSLETRLVTGTLLKLRMAILGRPI